MLKDIRAAVQKAIDEGTTLRDFQKELKPLLKQKGWWGKIPDPKNPEKEIQLGSVRRLEKIFDINVRTAYQTGRYNDLAENAQYRPYWQYIAVMDDRTRKEHKSLHGKVFRWDDPFWDTFFPPNGWNCRCTVKSLSERELKQRGLTVENTDGKLISATATLPNGQKVTGKVYRNGGKIVQTDVGWNYNPGKAAYQPMDDGADPVLARRFRELGEGKDPTAWEKPLVDKIWPSLNRKGITQTLKDFNVTSREVKSLKNKLSEEEIIKKLGGFDMTNGSCFSQALAYIGNKFGFNVSDYRGGRSRLIFSYSSKELCRITKSQYTTTKSSLLDAIKRLEEVEEGKEYFFVAGNHAAIVRRKSSELEYLELQIPGMIGFNPLNEETLRSRFRVKDTNIDNNGKYYYTVDCLIDITKFNIPKFKSVLEYVNTYEDKQFKK